MNTNIKHPDNIVQVKHFNGENDVSKTGTKSSVAFQVVEGDGPTPLEFDSNMEQLFGLFTEEELVSERKLIVSEAVDHGDAITLAMLRMGKGLSQQGLASLMDTSQSRISRLESGREEPGFKTIDRLSQVLACEYSDICNAFKAISK